MALDLNDFMDSTTDEALVKRPPLTAGATFLGMIGEPKTREWQGKQDPSKSGVAIDLPIEIDLNSYPDEKARLGGIDKVTLTHSVMLDTRVDPSTGKPVMDTSPGKNGALRRVRDATNLNVPGQRFNLRMLQGRQVLVKIKHEEYPVGSGDIFDRVDSLAKPA